MRRSRSARSGSGKLFESVARSGHPAADYIASFQRGDEVRYPARRRLLTMLTGGIAETFPDISEVAIVTEWRAGVAIELDITRQEHQTQPRDVHPASRD